MKALYYSILQYQPENLTLLREYFDVIELTSPDDDSDALLADIDVGFAPLGYFFDKSKIDRMPKLKCIASNTTGEPHIDRAYAESKKISVCSLMREQEFLGTITPTAEHTWGLLLATVRHTPWAFQAALNGTWDRRPWGGAAMLSRMSIGIVGFGRLGKLVGDYARAFRMKGIRWYDPNVSEGPIDFEKMPSLESLVSVSDIVTLHIPSTEATHKLFDARLFAKFKHGSVLINTSRGELVDDKDLTAALESGQIARVGLDVFDGEYGPGGGERWKVSPLREYARTHRNILITPHIAGSTIDAWRETERRVIENVISTVVGQRSKVDI